MRDTYVKRCAIWYHLYNLKKSEKHPWRSVTLKVTFILGFFSRFLNYTNGIKSHNASHMKINVLWPFHSL